MPSSRLPGFLQFPAMFVIACAMMAGGCAAFDPWKPSGQWKDPPFAYGKKAAPMYRRHTCMMCPTGESTEQAFMADGRTFYKNAVSEEAAALVLKSSGAQWTVRDKAYDGTPRLFAPLRIIVASLEPLVVMTIPWSYQTATPERPFLQIGDEIRKFY